MYDNPCVHGSVASMKKIISLFLTLFLCFVSANATQNSDKITESQMVNICLHGIGIGFSPKKINNFYQRSVFALNDGYIDFVACLVQDKQAWYESLLSAIVFAKSKMPETYYLSVMDNVYAKGNERRFNNASTLPIVEVDKYSSVLHGKYFQSNQNPEDVATYLLSSKL